MPVSANHISLDDAFVDKAIDRLPEMYKNSENVKKFIEIESERFKSIYDISISVAEALLLTNASGSILDDIGREFNLYREGDSDDNFRLRIQIKAYSKNATGTRDNFLDAIARFIGITTSDIDFISLDNKRVEVTLPQACLTSDSVYEQIKLLFPLVTNYTITVKAIDPPLKFSVIDDNDDELIETNTGFLSVIDDNGDVVSDANTGRFTVITVAFS